MKSLGSSKIVQMLFVLFIFQSNYSQNNSAKAEEMLDLVNDLRLQQNLAPLTLHQNLNKAAYDHAKDMGDNNYFSHTGLNGSRFGERVKETGYTGSSRGENIAAGYATAQRTFEQWVNSSGHLDNMLNPSVNEMGIGYAEVDGSRYTHYWTQILEIGDTSPSLTLEDPISAIRSDIDIYPNPAQDIVAISFPKSLEGKTKLSLTTMTGQVIHQQTTDPNGQKTTLNIAHLAKGIYIY